MRPRVRDTALTILGACTLLVGAYLRWAHPNPDELIIVTPPRQVFDNLQRGIELVAVSADLAVVISAVLGLVSLGFTTRPRVRATLLVLAGLGALLVCVSFLVVVPVGLDAAWLLSLGWYLTVFGGFLFLAVAYLTVAARDDPVSRQSPTTN